MREQGKSYLQIIKLVKCSQFEVQSVAKKFHENSVSNKQDKNPYKNYTRAS